MSTNTPRILAIDPGTRHMGVAVLAGPELIYYAVRDFKRKRPADELLRATRKALLALIAKYAPTVLAYEKTFYVQAKSSALLHVQEAEIARVAKVARLEVVGYSPAHVRKVLCRDGRATKQRVADLLTRRFPELAGYRHRGEPLREQYWLNMFDAVAVAAVCADAAMTVNGQRSAGPVPPVPSETRGDQPRTQRT